ncbi:hypothetical protein V6N13_044983 [Hibiscus sabdariffa]
MDIKSQIHLNFTNARSYVREYEECDLLFEAIIWNLWLDRNSVVFEVSMEDKHSFLARCPPFHMCVSRALAMTRRILNVTKDGTTLASQGNDWQSPPADWVKLNTDGARHGESGHASYGGIIRDTEKAWILGYTKFIGVIVEVDCMDMVRLIQLRYDNSMKTTLLVLIMSMIERG